MDGLVDWWKQPTDWSFLTKQALTEISFDILASWLVPAAVVILLFSPALLRWRERAWLREAAKRDRIDISLTLAQTEANGVKLSKRPLVQFHLGDLFDFHEVQTLQKAISASLKRSPDDPLANLLIIDDANLRYRIYSDIFTAINGTLSRAAYTEDMFTYDKRRSVIRKWVKMALAFEPDAHSPQINILLLQPSLEALLDNENLYFEMNQATMTARLKSLRNMRAFWQQEDKCNVPEHRRVVRMVELAKLS